MTGLRKLINYLKKCQDLRASGCQVSYTSDPTWLINQAINRRGGYLDDPSTCRGSCLPTERGRYPRKAEGDTSRSLYQLARRINTPRLIVREGELGEWRNLLLRRLPGRFLSPEEDF